MKLSELKEAVDNAISYAREINEPPEEVQVSIQIEFVNGSAYSDRVSLHYDGDSCASGCVIVGHES